VRSYMKWEGAIMEYDSPTRYRRSIRLKGYDYTQAGGYFLTICTHDRLLRLGSIFDGKMILSKEGLIVCEEWQKSAEIRKGMKFDAFVVMPNHIHGIVFINDDDVIKKDGNKAVGAHSRAPLRKPRPLGSFVAGFKSATTKRVNEFLGTPCVPFWQSNYYEHIIRHDKSLNIIRRYIENNPLMWKYDMENSDALRLAPEEMKHLFAQQYGYTDEELDFIINYDTKYRLVNGTKYNAS